MFVLFLDTEPSPPSYTIVTGQSTTCCILPYFLEPDGKVVLIFFLTWIFLLLLVRHSRENPFMNTTSRLAGNLPPKCVLITKPTYVTHDPLKLKLQRFHARNVSNISRICQMS